jgi:hypothetical protein
MTAKWSYSLGFLAPSLPPASFSWLSSKTVQVPRELRWQVAGLVRLLLPSSPPVWSRLLERSEDDEDQETISTGTATKGGSRKHRSWLRLVLNGDRPEDA